MPSPPLPMETAAAVRVPRMALPLDASTHSQNAPFFREPTILSTQDLLLQWMLWSLNMACAVPALTALYNSFLRITTEPDVQALVQSPTSFSCSSLPNPQITKEHAPLQQFYACTCTHTYRKVLLFQHLASPGTSSRLPLINIPYQSLNQCFLSPVPSQSFTNDRSRLSLQKF